MNPRQLFCDMRVIGYGPPPPPKPLIELFSNIFSTWRPEGIFLRARIAFFPPYTERSIMTVRHYERHKVHPV